MLIRYMSDGAYYEAEVKEVDILTKKGIAADSIPEDEWTQGFRVKEADDETVF